MLPVALIVASTGYADVVVDVREAVAERDFASADRFVQEYRRQNGVTPEMLEAVSWIARGALAQGQLDRASAYATEVQTFAAERLKTHKLDEERHLPIALGAAIEVQAQAMAAQGERSSAVDYLNRQLALYRATSIRTRIQKNLHLLSLEGKSAPKLEGVAVPKGKPVLLFFWAHWCPDCKNMVPALARLRQEFKGLEVIAPTQRYGYTRRGQDASPAAEAAYIVEVWKEKYGAIADAPTPLNEENFRNYGASTTPTLVLVDRNGVVKMYHPGAMGLAELEQKVKGLFH